MPAADLSNLSVVVTHYRTPELLLECLKRLAMHAPGVTTLVVDTGGEADQLVPAKRAFPAVRFTQTVNHSLANAVNTGLKQTATSFVLQMNADVLLLAGTVQAMLKRLQAPEVGMVGPRCYTPAGGWQDQGVLYRPYYAYLTLTEQPAVRVPWLSGCCQLLRREAVEKVGGMNSSLRFYNEDVEWCWRLRRTGYRCELVHAAALHVGGASTPPDDRFVLEGLRGGMVLSQRYKPRLYRSLHRAGVRRYAEWRSRGAADVGAADVGAADVDPADMYQQVARMFSAGRFDESPFGDTLTESSPALKDPEI